MAPRFSALRGRGRLRALWWLAGREAGFGEWVSSNPLADCAWYPGCRKLAVVNNSGLPQRAAIRGDAGEVEVSLKPYELCVIDI